MYLGLHVEVSSHMCTYTYSTMTLSDKDFFSKTHLIFSRVVAVELSGHKPCVAGGGLPETDVLDQFHFHWGLDAQDENGHFVGTGSEHLVDGYQYPLEVGFECLLKINRSKQLSPVS